MPECTSYLSDCLRSRTPPAPVENTQIIYFSLQTFFHQEVKNVPITFKLMFSPILAFFNQNHYAGRSIMGLLFCFTRTVTLILTVRPILLYSLDSRSIPISIPCIRNNMSIECRILGIFSRAGVDPCNSSYITVSHSALNFCDCSNYVEKCEYIWDGRAFKIQVSSFL